MSSLVFPDERTLLGALRLGLIPPELARAPARCRQDETGRIWVEGAVEPAEQTQKALAACGVRYLRRRLGQKQGRSVRSWAELPKPRAVAAPQQLGGVLFRCPSEARCRELALALLGLGASGLWRAELRSADEPPVHLLRALRPARYAVEAALDGLYGALTVYLPHSETRSDSWCEWGYRHPLGSQLAAAEDRCLLIDRDGHLCELADLVWRPLDQLLDLAPLERQIWQSVAPQRLVVPLTLVRSERQLSELLLWRESGREQLLRLVAELSAAEREGLRFALSENELGGTLVLMGARLGRLGVPAGAVAYGASSELPGLLLPSGFRLEPSLPRAVLVRTLALRDDELCLLSEGSGSPAALRQLTIPLKALQPMRAWVDYVLEAEGEALGPWWEGARFELAEYLIEDGRWSDELGHAAPLRDDFRTAGEGVVVEAKRFGPGTTLAEHAPPAGSTPSAPPKTLLKRPSRSAPPSRGTEEDRARLRPSTEPLLLAPPRSVRKRRATADRREEVAESSRPSLAIEEVERHLLADGTAAGSSAAGWEQLAERYARAGRLEDAGRCWPRVLWALAPAEWSRVAARWRALEREASPEPQELESLVARAADRAGTVRAAVAALVGRSSQGVPSSALELGAIGAWFDRHDQLLDVRSLWLARQSLAVLAGGDPLTLSYGRQRVWERLRHGLSLWRDVPSFVRLRGAGSEHSSAEAIGTELGRLVDRFYNAKRRRSAVEAPLELTGAYLSFVLAFGLARLGASGRAVELAAHAEQALAGDDPVHRYLCAAYRRQIEGALEGRSPEAGVDAELEAELGRLSRLERYKVDRLRELSLVLAPAGAANALEAFQRADSTQGPPAASLRLSTELMTRELVRLRELADAPRAAAMMALARDFPALAEAEALPLVEALLAEALPGREALSAELAGALCVTAGCYERADIFEELLPGVAAGIAQLVDDNPEQAAQLLGDMVVAARRLGCAERGLGLIDRFQPPPGRDLARMSLQLAVAQVWSLRGEPIRALETMALAHAVLEQGLGSLHEEIALTRRMAATYGAMPLRQALVGLRKLGGRLPQITDSLNTNSHFCLSAVAYVDALVFGMSGEALVFGPEVSHWLEADEENVREGVRGRARGVTL